MKILIYSNYWHPENGVPQRRWQWLSSILQQSGHEVVVIAPYPHYERSLKLLPWFSFIRQLRKEENQVEIGPSGERIIRTAFFPTGRSLSSKALDQGIVALGSLYLTIQRPGYLKGFSPDLILGTVPALPTAIVAQLAAKFFSRPYVLDLRDAWPALLDESSNWNLELGEPSWREKIMRRGPLQVVVWIVSKLLVHSLSHSSAVITTSELLKESLIEDLPGKPVVTIRNVFPACVESPSRKIRSKGSGRLNVLYAGTVGRAQDLSNAIEAVDILEKRGIDVKLRIVGSGAAFDALKKQTYSKKNPNIQFFSRVPARELGSFYGWADTALIHLADWHSLRMTIPSKAYELIDQGIFITAVAQGEAADLISNLGVGCVVEPGSPGGLAEVWFHLAQENSLSIPHEAQVWVDEVRNNIAPEVFLKLISDVRDRRRLS